MIVEGAMRKNHTLTINLEQKIPPAEAGGICT